MTQSKYLLFFCLSFILGIGLYSFVKFPQTFVWGVLFLGILTIIISFFLKYINWEIFVFLGFCLLFFVFGVLRMQIAEFKIDQDPLKKLNDKPEKVTLTGIISKEPDIRDKYQKFELKVNESNSVVLVTAESYPEYRYLDEIKITGNLKAPLEFENFSYKNYLLKEGIYSVMDFPKIESISKDHKYTLGTFLYEKILILKQRLKNSIDSNFPTPQNFIVKGIVLGDDKNMPSDLRGKFNATGLSHVTAVSGSNIIMLVLILVPLLLIFGFWRSQALYLSFILIWLYIILVGLPASGIRAGIMGTIFLFAQILGRQNTSSRIIFFAAALMLLQNPWLLAFDVGFQLSFLASIGIIYLKPIIDSFCKFKFLKNSKMPDNQLFAVFKNKLKHILDIFSVTISAQLLTLPIIAFNFQNISLAAPLTNLLALPVVSLLMFLGLFSAIFGMFSKFLGWVFYLPSSVLLNYFSKILDIFYQPWLTLMAKDIYWIWIAIYYLVIIFLILYFNKKLKPDFLEY